MLSAYISHPDCLLHQMEHGIAEVPERLTVVENEIKASPLSNKLKFYLAPLASKEQLALAHDHEYIEYIFLSSPKAGLVPLDPDTWMNPHSLTAALRAAGSAIMAVDLVMNQEVQSAFCNIRPPGHHAERSVAMGFCIFNNIAIAAAYALKHYQLSRVAIIDFDVHHGNGTENIFQHDPRVLYCSSFQHPFYPFSGADTQSSHIVNIPLSAGSTSDYVKNKILECWAPKLLEFKPEILLFSAGFDAYAYDDMSDLSLLPEDYAWITKKIIELTQASTNNKIISMLEGGYSLSGLGSCALSHLTEIVNCNKDRD